MKTIFSSTEILRITLFLSLRIGKMSEHLIRETLPSKCYIKFIKKICFLIIIQIIKSIFFVSVDAVIKRAVETEMKPLQTQLL